MTKGRLSTMIKTYTHRFKVQSPYFFPGPDADLCLSIVIPSYKEPDISTTLRSLGACQPPLGLVEIIIVLNAPDNSEQEALKINQGTARQIEQWKEEEKPDFIELFVIREESLPPKHAGAGWARKIGMDEAVQRWASTGTDGPIICLDADCTVSQDYLIAAEKCFSDPAIKVGHFYFEHLYQKEPDLVLREGIMHYELHLRCYIQGLKNAGYPFAVHTVGSCMAVRASMYAKSGGMNRRKAGEDFYFLHKLFPMGGWKYIPAYVYPSSRISDRVPFGTGRSQNAWQKDPRNFMTYHPEVYTLLKPMFQSVPNWYTEEITLKTFSPVLTNFLNQVGFLYTVQKMKSQSNTSEVFCRKIWQWMDGFMILRLTHYLRDHGFPNQPVMEVASILLKATGFAPVLSLPELLEQYRSIQT